MFVTGSCLILVLLLTSTYNLTASKIYSSSQKKKSHFGTCQIYNGSVCSDIIGNRHVYLKGNKPIHKIEKRLAKWFSYSKRIGQITKECWPHARALTCIHFYPECNVNKDGPARTSLCSKHCKFMNQNICKIEFRKARHSSEHREYIPLCEEVTFTGDSDCFYLPTVNFSKPPEPYSEGQKRYRKPAGKAATLKCIFGIRNFKWETHNAHMVTEGTWYLGQNKNRRIVGSKRLITRTIQKGTARLFMTLKIRNVSKKDEGLYHCVITFANKTVQSTAQLTVFNRQDGKVKVIPAGKCVPYESGFCSQYFHRSTNLIFEKHNHQIEVVDRQLEDFIKRLSSLKKLSQKCLEFGQPVLCYHKLKQCDTIRKIPIPTLCKRDCYLFKNVYCKDELSMISTTKGLLSLYIPDCKALSDDNANCISIQREPIPTLPPLTPNIQMPCEGNGESGLYNGALSVSRSEKTCDMWSSYRSFSNLTHNFCRNHGESIPWCFVNGVKEYCYVNPCQQECYENRGEDYYGRVSNSISGKSCLPWNSVTLRYSNVDHSFCRNFEGDLPTPWCYVDRQNTRELCAVPKCRRTEIKESQISLAVYIVPVVIVASLVLFSLSLFIFHMKKKKIIEEAFSENVTEEDSSIDKHFPVLPSFQTISTTVSLDFNKDSPAPSESQSSLTPPLAIRKTKSCRKNVPEVKESQLKKLEKIGDGKLGQLWQGEFIEDRNHVIPIVVRKLKRDTRSCVISSFRMEMNSLKNLRHPNIQQVICVSALSEVPFIAFECRHRLDLKEFLKGNDYMDLDILVDCIIQITYGLEYLHSRKFIHKDIAARNMFISPDGVVQISKSGLGVYRYPNDYEHLPGVGLSPVRWLSPECLQTGIYGQCSDVYMFGILIWEMFALGAQPYGEFNNDSAIEQIINGYRLESPVTCPGFIWDIAEQCTIVPGHQRPTISVIKELVEAKRSCLRNHSDIRTIS